MSTDSRPNKLGSLGKKGKTKDKKDKESPSTAGAAGENGVSSATSPLSPTGITKTGGMSASPKVKDARRMFEQLSAGASSGTGGSPSFTKRTPGATGSTSGAAASSLGKADTKSSSPATDRSPVASSRKSPGGSKLKKAASLATTEVTPPKSSSSSAASATSESSYPSDTGSRPKNKPGRPPPPVPPSGLTKSQSASETFAATGTSKESAKGHATSPTAQAKDKKGKGKDKEKVKEKEKKEKEEKEKKEKEKKEREEKEKKEKEEKQKKEKEEKQKKEKEDKDKKERERKEKEKKEKEEKEKREKEEKERKEKKEKEEKDKKEKEKKEREEKEKKEKEEKDKKEKESKASVSAATGQSKDKAKVKGGSLFGKKGKSAAGESQDKPSLATAAEPIEDVDSHRGTTSPTSSTSKVKKDEVKTSTDSPKNSPVPKNKSSRYGSNSTDSARRKATDSPNLSAAHKSTKSETSSLQKPRSGGSISGKGKTDEDKGKEQKEGGALNKHLSPKGSPTHSSSNPGSATSTPKATKSSKIGGGHLKPGSVGATGSLSSGSRERIGTGGTSIDDAKVKRNIPVPATTNVLSDKDLKITLADGTTVVTGAELRPILNKQLVYLSGGLEEGKHPILTFPEVGLKHLDTSIGLRELKTTLLYLKTLMSISDLNAGMTLLLDVRNSRTHTPAKRLLEKIVSKDVPLEVHVIYIYTKTNIFGRNKQLFGTDVSAKLHLAYLYDQKSLTDQLDVTTEFGGNLNYHHKLWVYNRLEYEKVQKIHADALAECIKLTEALDLCEVPSCVKDAEHLLTEDLKLKETLTNKMAEAELSADGFLETLKRQYPDESMEMSPDTKEVIMMLGSLNGLLTELKAELRKFDSFWVIHKARVDHMMRKCHFNRSAEKLKVLMKEYIADVKSEGVVLGDNLETALELGEKHEAFVTKCKTTMDGHMGKIREDAQELIHPSFMTEGEGKVHAATQQAIDSVKAQVDELKTNYKELTDLCQQKRDLFIVCVKFHMTTRQVQQWNQDVLEFLASLPLEDMSPGDATTNLSRIDDLHDLILPSQLATMTELADSLPGEKQFKKMASKAKEKYEQTCSLLDTRKAHIMKQQATQAHSSSMTKSKSVKKPKSQTVELINGDGSGPAPPASRTLSSLNPEASVFLAKTLGGESSEHTDGESDAKVLSSRQFVYKELLATEKVYIEDLKIILNSYYDAMDPEFNTSMPLRLRDKRHVVFGNLPDIHKFHESVFSQALQRYEEHPERVGECFIQFTDEFQMYSVYCKNRTQSEALINECTESSAFFKGIQLNLAHQLSLDSYLLKPVQRITKYQLLLKDMMKHSVNAQKAHSDLQQALDRMLKVLKNLNDSLHVVGLKGFPGSLAEQGRLLVHDPFQVWEESSTSRSLFSRARERHVFLFEKMVIFSKKFEAPVQKREKKADNYLYKGHLPMAEIGLRPTSDGQPLQFELNIHGQQKVFKFQAQTKEVREMWFAEIRRLLEAQFTLMKDVVLKSGTLNRQSYKGKAQLSTHSKESRLFGNSIEDQSVKKSLSITDRFKFLKNKRKGGDKLKKTVSAGGGVTAGESPLMQSCSLPPNVIHSVGGGGAGRSRDRDAAKGLTQSNLELGRNMDAESVSSDEEFTFSDEDEGGEGVAVDHYETLAPSAPRYYLAICDYNPGDSDENGISLTADQEVEVIGINQYGWWWVRATNATSGEVEEGWVPASYLRVFSKHYF